MVLSQSAEDQNRKQMQNVNIQNVSHLQKQDLCQRDRDVQLSKEKVEDFYKPPSQKRNLAKGGRGCKLAMKGRGRAYGKNS